MDGQRMDKPRSIYPATAGVSTQGVGDLKDGTQHALGQRIQLIGVDRRSSAAKLKCRPDAKALKNNSSAADKRRSTPIFGRKRGTRPVQLIPGRCTRQSDNSEARWLR